MAATTKAREAAAAAGDLDAAARLRARRPAEKTVILADDDSLATNLATAIQADQAARALGNEDTQKTAAENLAAARAAVASDAITMRLRSIGRAGFAKVQADHPPADEDHQALQRETGDATAKVRWARTFPAALIAACLVEPAGITADELTDMLDDGRISDGEMTALFAAAHNLHQGSRTADLGK